MPPLVVGHPHRSLERLLSALGRPLSAYTSDRVGDAFPESDCGRVDDPDVVYGLERRPRMFIAFPESAQGKGGNRAV